MSINRWVDNEVEVDLYSEILFIGEEKLNYEIHMYSECNNPHWEGKCFMFSLLICGC